MNDQSYDFGIEEVLAHYGWDLPGLRGGWQSIKCGAHDDSHASCRISTDANQVKCLACDFAGDALSVIQYYEKDLTFRECVQRLEEITGGSGSGVRPADRRGRGVSRRKGDNTGGRRYQAPRSRGRSSSWT